MQGNRVIQQVFANANFASSDAYEALLNQIMQRLRTIILQVIRTYRASQVVVTTAKPANAVVSIFGTGGANSVQVETPNYQYDYTHDKKRK